MKQLRFICFFIFIFLWLALPLAKSQDSLDIKILSQFSSSFSIVNGQLIGEGAELLERETRINQFTMLGEYHGSKRISEFTTALIPILDKNEYKNFALEVGPISAQVISELTASEKDIVSELHKFNSKYNYEKGEYTAIPFFSYVEDAQFLEQAKKSKWNFIGIDQEFCFGFEMLLDKMFEQLSTSQKTNFQKSYQLAKDTLSNIIADDFKGSRRFPETFYYSAEIQSFLDSMEQFPKNHDIVIAIRKSTEIYKMNNDRKWRQNNENRALYMKTNLRRSFQASNFDLSRDKLFIKMGAYHLSKGESPMNVFDVGNMLNELAEYHGNSSINICFDVRHYLEDGLEKDILIEEPNHSDNVLLQMGKKDEWVIIDLREIQHGLYYYPIKYLVPEKIEDLVRRYDLLIIPPIEMNPTKNFK